MEPRLYTRIFDDDTGVLKARLAETTLLLDVLAHVNSLISKVKKFEDFCGEVSKLLQEKFKFTYFHIWVRDETNPSLLRLATPENRETFRSMPINTGIVGKALREGRTICVPDVSQEPEYLNTHSEVKSELCVPLKYNGGFIGAINIETDTYQTFAGYLSIIEIIAQNLAHSMRLAMLYSTEEQFKSLVEHMSEGLWVGDDKDSAIYVNPAYEKMTGYEFEDMRGKTTYDFFDEPSGAIIRKENERRKQGLEGHYEATYIAKNGERIPIMIHAVPFGKGGSMATLTDLRPIKNAETKLMRAERFLASITQCCPEAIVGFDEKEESIVKSWNTGAEHMFGYKTDEITGKSIKIIIPEDKLAAGEFDQLYNEAISKGFVRNFETMRLHKNGAPIAVSITVNAIKDNKGNLIGLAALYRDITAQKKWERELQDRFEKMQEAYREMGKQRRYLDYIIDIVNMSTSSAFSKKQIATFMVNAMVVITRVDAVTLRILDKNSGKLILTAQSGVGEEWWSKKAIPYSGSLLESAAANNGPIKILDVLSDSRYTSPALARKNNLRSALIIPLQIKGEVLGSLTLYLSQESNLRLLDDEFIFLFAKQAALALKLSNQ